MTTADLIDELKRSLGNRADISDERYVRWLNWAIYDVIGYHRKRAYPSRRFHFLEDDILFNSIIVTGTIEAATATTFDLAAGDQEADDYYNDMVIELDDGQIRLISDYVNVDNKATIAEAWDTNPTGISTYSIYRRKYTLTNDVGLDPGTQIFSIQSMEFALTGSEITQKNWKELVGIDLDNSLGDPTSFARRGNNLLFNKAPNTVETLRLFYYRLPTLLYATDLTAECELPNNFEEAVVLGATYRGFDKLLEPDRADEAFDKYNKRIVNTLDAYSIEEYQMVKQVTVRRGEY